MERTAVPSRPYVGSYEDLLVTHYLEGLFTQRKRPIRSPYAQAVRNVSSADEIGFGSRRTLEKKNGRPSSARIRAAASVQQQHLRFRSRSASLSSNSSRPSCQSTPTRSHPNSRTPVYLRPPPIVCINAHKNGSHDMPVKVTSRANMTQLLEECTSRLGLTLSAKRLFLSDGTEVKDVYDLKKDENVYVSSGQPFRDPLQAGKGSVLMRKSVEWTLDGVQLPPNDKRGKTKSSLSSRLKSLVERRKPRILVFRNGMTTEGVEIPQMNSGDFVASCTQRLQLESRIKCFYDLECRRVYDPVDRDKDFYCIDQCLQGDFAYLGPLWAVQGCEQFKVSGALEYVTHLVAETKTAVMDKNKYISKLTHPLPGTSEAELTTSQAADRAEKALSLMAKMKVMIDDLEEIAEKLRKKLVGETVDGKGAKRADLVGCNGLRVKIHENGTLDNGVLILFNLREAEKGIGNDKEKLRLRFLDECSMRKQLMASSGALTSIATKIFNKDGEEITDVHRLVSEQDVWLSYGEPFKPLEVTILELELEPVIGVEHDGRLFITKKSEDISDMKIVASDWDIAVGYPASAVVHNTSSVVWQDEVLSVGTHEGQVYLQQMSSPKSIISPQLATGIEPQKGSTPMQHWILDQTGHICSKALPQLALTVLSDVAVETQSKRQGFAVDVSTRLDISLHQSWHFNNDGSISSALDDRLVLTFLGTQPATAINTSISHPPNTSSHSIEQNSNKETVIDINELSQREPNDESRSSRPSQPPGCSSYVLAVLERVNKMRLWSAQRWAFKQKTAFLIGQQRESKVVSPEWHVKGLLWPSNENGSWNDELVWPVDGLLLPHVPPIMWPRDTKGALRRFSVQKNGEKSQLAVDVLEPEVMTARRKIERQSRLPPGTKKWLQRRKEQKKALSTHSSPTEEIDTQDVHTMQFHAFLDRCTVALSLPFAARRLFDRNGKEVKVLSHIENNQLLYASCGEAWLDPTSDSSRMQESDDAPRRVSLPDRMVGGGNAWTSSSESEKILKDVVLEVVGSIAAGDRVSVGGCQMDKKQRAALIRHVNETRLQLSGHDTTEASDVDVGDQMSHCMAHHRADEKMRERLRSTRPWELDDYQGMDGTGPLMPRGVDNTQATQMTNLNEGSTVLKTKKMPRRIPSQQWRYTDGYFELQHADGLVLGIKAKTNESSEMEGDSIKKIDSNVVCLCQKETNNRYQQWMLDEDGFIHTVADSKLVLSLRSRMVLRSFSGSTTAGLQYLLSNPFGTELVVCERLSNPTSLQQWQQWRYDDQTGFIFLLTGNRKEDTPDSGKKSVKQVLSTISTSGVYKQPTAYRIRAFVNGESEKTAVTVTASDINELLDLCTVRLGLTSAARRLYSLDGYCVDSLDGLQRDQLVAVSCGETFVEAEEKKRQVAVKALWARSHSLSSPPVPPATQR
ncbi:doublecortin domain-containing protein 1-like [Corticium candelabrum]|uniref:doublecortin domain-containing protein 1-like n=1 Tax=Corticium candelabrum TaxID=121492 RepID=UPI002E254219|nr:doublecortin domain-containing protein 1-like [Corticium candelabrum]